MKSKNILINRGILAVTSLAMAFSMSAAPVEARGIQSGVGVKIYPAASEADCVGVQARILSDTDKNIIAVYANQPTVPSCGTIAISK